MLKEKKELKTEYVSLWLEGTIMIGLYAEVHIDLEIAKKIVEERIRVFGTIERQAIIELRGAVSFTKEARDYLGSKEACVGLTKLALVANSPITITLGNFYIKITKPPVKTRIFANKEDAKKWLMKN